MALARVVSFEGVSEERIAELSRTIEAGEQPEGMNASEMLLLHDSDGQQSLAIIFFDTEEDYQNGHEILDGMDRGDTPGNRTAVTKYAVAAHASPAKAR
jgi:hypothetical protein